MGLFTIISEALIVPPETFEVGVAACGSTPLSWNQIFTTAGTTSLTGGETLYVDSGLTTVFNGGDNTFRYRTFPGAVIFNNSIDISTVGVTSNSTGCGIAGTAFNGVLEVDDCLDSDGINTLVDGTGSTIGDTIFLQGTSTPFSGGNNFYRLTFGGGNGFIPDTGTLIISADIFQIDNTGTIISITTC